MSDIAFYSLGFGFFLGLYLLNSHKPFDETCEYHEWIEKNETKDGLDNVTYHICKKCGLKVT